MGGRKQDETNPHWSRIVGKSLLAVDLSCSRKLAFCADSATLRPLMMLLELSGHGVPWISGVLFGLYRSTAVPEKEFFLNFLLALVIDLVVVGLLKVIFRRPRPAYNKSDMFLTVSIDGYSFPSGHATRALMVTTFVFINLKARFAAKTLMATWALCVGASRVVLGRHHVSDVIVGFIVGYLQYYWLVDRLWITWSDFEHHVLSLVLGA